MRGWRAACAALLAVFMAAPLRVAAVELPAAASSVPADEEYKLHPGDVLQISVYPQAELSGSLVVFEDGTVPIATVGRVMVMGLTRTEVTKKLTDALSQYFVHPRITVSIVKFSERNVVLTGEVHAPGIFPFTTGMRLSEAIAEAGGFTLDADRKNVRLFRGEVNHRSVEVFDVDAFLTAKAGGKDPELRMGDLIEVPRLVTAIYIWGQVRAPGRYDYFIDMTIHDLIARAQGLSDTAKLNAIRVFHADGTTTDVDFAGAMRGDHRKNIQLRPGDIVVVPNRSLAKIGGWLGILQPYFAAFGFVLSILILSKTGI